MSGKREITLRREAVLKQLRNLDQKFKFTSAWDGDVTRVFKEADVYCFDELVRTDLTESEKLIARWKNDN